MSGPTCHRGAASGAPPRSQAPTQRPLLPPEPWRTERPQPQATRAQHPRLELGNRASQSAALSGPCGRAGTAGAADSESETKLSSRLGPRPAAALAPAVLTSGLHEDARAAPGGGGSLSPQGRGPSFRAARPLPAAAAARRGHQLLPVTWRPAGAGPGARRGTQGCGGVGWADDGGELGPGGNGGD